MYDGAAYTEQTSWMLFLKYLDDLEKERELQAQLHDKPYSYIIDDAHRWSRWAAPRKRDGSFDHDRALTGDDLIAYVNGTLFPYLQGFKTRATGANTIEYKIGERRRTASNAPTLEETAAARKKSPTSWWAGRGKSHKGLTVRKDQGSLFIWAVRRLSHLKLVAGLDLARRRDHSGSCSAPSTSCGPDPATFDLRI